MGQELGEARVSRVVGEPTSVRVAERLPLT